MVRVRPEAAGAWRRRVAIALTMLLVAALAAADAEAPSIDFQDGPRTGALADRATIHVPGGYRFVPQEQMGPFNEATGNLPDPSDVGALMPDREDPWVVFFAFDEIGYIEDAASEKLDADAMLKEFKDSDADANEARQKQGLPQMTTIGWSRSPFFDSRTNNLTWGLRLRAGQDEVINHNIRLLGRHGVMRVIVAADPAAIDSAVAEVETLLQRFDFNPGQRYAEFSKGDKLAKIGLTGLVLGGGAALAAKTGLLAQLAKFAKVIILGLIAAGAAVGRFVKGLFSRPKPAMARATAGMRPPGAPRPTARRTIPPPPPPPPRS